MPWRKTGAAQPLHDVLLSYRAAGWQSRPVAADHAATRRSPESAAGGPGLLVSVSSPAAHAGAHGFDLTDQRGDWLAHPYRPRHFVALIQQSGPPVVN
ncbi:hypothetical protein GCM10011583_74740 [Streptomyces camponoticapitis]|uniref:Uncharacterized protein n=1 Tax=Streptomyces camponoticapitis TaxID=1616125 RepID=A0ABQ2F200_9ACTN|nr:hypothetical protein [Streptomyces camponoticapitis]GGK32018.1 hypothetical protein GCM10011583_74740 [Streptomyces camponoticapitis]